MFQACLQLVNILVLGLTAVNSPLQPKIAAAWSQGDIVKVQRLTTESVRIASGFSIIFFCIIFFCGDIILLLYGEEFVQANSALKILLLGQVVNAFCGPCALLLIMTGRQNLVLKGFSASIVFGTLLGYVLIPNFGINGAAMVSVGIMIFWNINMSFLCFKRLSINTTPVKRLPSTNFTPKNNS